MTKQFVLCNLQKEGGFPLHLASLGVYDTDSGMNIYQFVLAQLTQFFPNTCQHWVSFGVCDVDGPPVEMKFTGMSVENCVKKSIQ
jgi:hypothetical protein